MTKKMGKELICIIFISINILTSCSREIPY
jgi:hypothetical protein